MRKIRTLLVSFLFVAGFPAPLNPVLAAPAGPAVVAKTPAVAPVKAPALVPAAGPAVSSPAQAGPSGSAILGVLGALVGAVAGNEAAVTVLIAFVLTLIPGKFRGIVRAVLENLVEGSRAKKAETAVSAAFVEYRPDRQADPVARARANREAEERAYQVAIKLGVPADEARGRVRAAFATLKAEEVVR